ncbi:PPR domain-containing protein/PPR_1 domain-containing protein/PPR_2 domain-containing protein [Cephalotus follicularis]|uniref:PPR domain-containing protein/PPR_1 domain-containing protein/PPR_2 domain-containing protein n=1 Tax=Cephalotus follicularis TaxID=3775 RepID=A0A1Q3CRG6_CEPFO|nr:PPR domain-containing protein/PPR_1 domain-containing protein/PPR_2 domain-containing protein [Cephalotus follicularis]
MLEPVTHSLPAPAPPVNHDSISTYKLTSVPFQRLNPSHQPVLISPPNNHTNLTLLDKPINTTTYASILDSCKCPILGKQTHAHTLKIGFHAHEFVETKLLQMYGRCGCLEDATLLFDKMLLRNLYTWTAILSLYVDLELFYEAFSLFQELQFEDIGLEFFVLPVVFKICSGLGTIDLGKQLHGIVIKYQFAANIYVANALIDMYGKFGSLDDAKKVLSRIPQRDCVSWNSVMTACAINGLVNEALEFLEKMSSLDNLTPNVVSWSAVIGGFSQNGYDHEAIEMLFRMLAEGLRPNARTLASVLPACARLRELSLGKEIHGYITRHGFMFNPFVVNGLVDVYRRSADMVSALKLFSKFSVKNAVSWNTIIVGYCENGDVSKAKEIFDQMELLGIEKDITSWNSMISGYVDNFLFCEALAMLKDLMMEDRVEPNSFTLGSALTACADLASLRQGKEIHSYAIVKGLQSDTFVGGALVDMYFKCGDLVAAQLAFNEVTERNTATWNALISGYARYNHIQHVEILLQKMKDIGFEPNVYTWNGIIAGYVENGHHALAMKLFTELQTLNLRPDIYTVGTILTACSRFATIERGKQVHAHSIRCVYDSDVHIGAALVDMYAKCGSIERALLAYNRITNPSLVSHNAMLTAYALHGLGEEGIGFFRKMLAHGFRPDHVTFLSVLSSCVHAGSVDTGYELFDLMGFYNLKPTLKHYTCMVDLLSRAGRIIEAYELIKKIPLEPDSVMWGALLGGCVLSRNVDIGEIAAEKLIELEPSNAGNYVLLANLYAYAARWSDLARMREVIKNGRMEKNPGCSWIEDRGEIHVFLAGDKYHKRAKEIYSALDNLTHQMKIGFVITTG